MVSTGTGPETALDEPSMRLRKRSAAASLTARAYLVTYCLIVGAGSGAGYGQEPDVSGILRRLRSDDAFESQRAEAELLRLGPDALPTLAQEILVSDRSSRFKALSLFTELIQNLLRQFESEEYAFAQDKSRLETLDRLEKATEARKKLKDEIEAAKEKDPQVGEKVQTLYEFRRIERAEKKAQSDNRNLPEAGRRRLAIVKAQIDEWRRDDEQFDETVGSLIDLYEAQAEESGEFTELEALRKTELAERVEERRPRVETTRRQLLAIGLPALNQALARRLTVRAQHRPFYDDFVTSGLKELDDGHLQTGREFEVVRYTRSLLWTWELDRKTENSAVAQRLLTRHLTATVKNLGDSDPLIRENAANELFLLGDRGTDALKEAISQAPASDPIASRYKFLLSLLTWRIRPSTYDRIGVHFDDFPSLSYRKKRRRIFDYARVAMEDATATLRAIVTNDKLEPNLVVKLAAARALSRLGDFSGFNFLIADRPDVMLQKPEISRDFMFLRGYDFIREKSYESAIEELRKVLDQYPFDFEANYWIAFAYLLVKRYEKSIHHFEIARRVNPEDQLTLYNLACAYALNGDTDEALTALEKSVDVGFTDAGHIEKDPDLKSLHGEDRFQQLLRKLKNSSDNR